ncbi:PAS domain S-box-containing protein [Roseateles saccharophilus]|uniref:PAS domain S-box-containing protein n=1 Tax=Roseateles saccharophilus TaxID=304 RepID=A0A4R3UNK2_ROSSA|nr:PAS domain S-box protein [Roseateles saccharophilus]TCU92522.1 PAS domain S-box-containing protein [Roseateles saccharophilus]
MRTNLPITQREFDFPAGVTLMSTTDTHSRINYANAAFIGVSGFDRDELMGQPHNLVRHPDMPTQAFADMWATLKAGESWTALVKNRRKNGDHYWVRANATPVIRNGQTTGYMSVRTKPSREEVAQAETLYRELREGRASHRAFRQGLVVRTGLLGWMSALQTMPIRWRIRVALGAVAVLGSVGAAMSGLAGIPLSTFATGLAAVVGAAMGWLEAQIARPLQVVQRQALSVAAGQPGSRGRISI